MSSLEDALMYRREERAAGAETTDDGCALVYRAEATPPFDRFQELCEDRDAKRAWEHSRRDLPDQETSTYDVVLAKCALDAGWTDQEVVNLLIFHRAKYFECLNLDGGYYTTLLGRVKAAGAVFDSTQGADAEVAQEQDRFIDALNRAFKLSIRKVTKYGGNGGTYELELADGRRVDLGTTASVLSHRLVKAAIADATTAVIPHFNQKQWDNIATAIFKAAGPAPIEDAAEQQEATWWLRACLNEASVVEVDERDRAKLAAIIRDRDPKGTWAYRNQNGQLLIHLGGFISKIFVVCGSRPTWRETTLRLRKLGFLPRDLEGKDATGKARVNVWAAPRGWDSN